MLKNRLFVAASIALLISALYIFHCTLPQDPNDPSNTSVTVTLRTSDWNQNNSMISDTVGNAVLIGAAINLPANIDSISINIAENGVPVFDTLIRDFTSGNRDTVWKKMYFQTPGAKTVTITPYSSLNLPPVIAVITIVDRVGPQNQKPSITVPETTIIRPAETCSLLIHVSDDDAGQLLKVTMTGDPAGAELLQDDTVFTWTVPADFIGYDTITFFVADNGNPTLFDTATAVIIVTLTPNPPIIEVIGDRSLRPLETCTLILRTSDSDIGQLLTFSMTSNPEGSIIKNDSLFIWTAPAGSLGEYKVTFTVTDNGDPPFSRSTIATITVIDGTVNHAPEWQEDTVKVDIADTSSYTLLLASKCSDPDDDSITYTLLYGSPVGDTIRSGWYEFTATSTVTGTHIVRIVAADSGNPADTLFLRLIVNATTRVKPSITQQPSDQSVTEGNKAIFTVTAGGVPTPTYQWKKNGTDIVGANFATCTTGVATIADNGTLYQCIITNSAGSVLSTSAKLIVDTLFTKPTITQQPHDTTVVTGGPASFSLTAAGTNLQYKWRKDNIALSTQPGSGVLALSAVTIANAGTYTVKVWNKADSVISSAVRLRVLPKTPGAPTLTVQSATGIKVSWSAVDGAVWYRLLRSLNSGAFASVCSTTQASTEETALVEGGSYSYRIIAGNSDGLSDTGSAAAVTMQKGPEITTQPTPTQLNKLYGEGVALSVAATGDPECTYQWQKNGIDLTGKTTASLSIPSVTVADSGSYRCVVTNSVRSVNSNSVKLTVLYTLIVTRTSAGGTITLVTDTAAYIPGASVTLTATANSGYRFVNWGGDVSSSSTNPLTVAVNKDQMAITANYVRQYTLTVTSASTAQGSVTPTSSVLLDVGVTTNITATPEAGFQFDNWTTTAAGVVFGNATTANTTVKLTSNNATVTANWAPVNYSVTYYANGGTSGSAPMDSKTYTSGSMATVLPNSGRLVKNSESFEGWNTSADGSGRTIACGGKITMTANVSLYAQYSTEFVMDNDGNIYSITKIGGKSWMRQNLMTTKYNNGDPIPLIENEDAWKNLLGGAYCWPMNDSANKEYGALYNWYAVNTGNLAPAGWHVATSEEWAELNDSLGDSAYCKMIDRWSTRWTNPPECGTNYYVFTANANGCRECQGTFGIFSELPSSVGFTGIKEGATWWTSTEYAFAPGAGAYFYYLDSSGTRNLYTGFEIGFGVRCVKD